jgi:hypothetical protein
MPRFFFDSEDGRLLVRDDQGEELAGVEAAQKEAIVIAASIAKDLFSRGEGTRVIVTVRDAEGALFEAHVSLTGIRLPRSGG